MNNRQAGLLAAATQIQGSVGNQVEIVKPDGTMQTVNVTMATRILAEDYAFFLDEQDQKYEQAKSDARLSKSEGSTS